MWRFDAYLSNSRYTLSFLIQSKRFNAHISLLKLSDGAYFESINQTEELEPEFSTSKNFKVEF